MKKSNPKVKKYLSDGTEAKVGMIVVVVEGKHDGNRPGTVTKITKLTVKKKDGDIFHWVDFRIPTNQRVFCKAMGYNYHPIKEYDVETPSWCEYITDLRKATPEERKEYYRNLHNKVS